MEDFTGQVVKSYELKSLVGQGGFGAVYLASQQFIGREVAIKIILPQYANRPEFIRRFETEAQLVARLEHPHIVPLYDYWREPSGAYLVMRWLRGGNVQEYIEKHGFWTPEATRRVLNQIGEALAVAHRQGVIHRDLKPENILLDENENAYLSDFGIAKDLINNTNITQTNAIVGSPAYLSPEQIKGEPVTPQTDIYAMGIVLYEMLTGERPFKDMTPATLMYKHLSESLPDISTIKTDLPPAINAVIQRATAKDPSLRYVDMVELAYDFRRAVKIDGAVDISEPLATGIVTSSSGITMPEPENPYKGLRAFQQADAPDFFGRDELTQKILGRLSEGQPGDRFLAVVGPSGSGKSSVVKAGVLPALRRGAIAGSDDWFFVEMVPGIDPLEELEAALLRIAVNPPESLLHQLREDDRGLVRALKRVLPEDNTELLLLIDQFEEVFTLLEEESERTHFLDSLLNAINDPRSRLRVIVTLRADFYDKPLNYSKFGNVIRERTEIVLPLSPEELEQAITGPATRVGLELEHGLVTAIVADVNEQPGALPLLQYALTELFERREGYKLTLSAYQDIGGTLGALARRADELFEALGEEGEEAARQVFLRLVTLGEGTEDTRRRVLMSELLTIGDDKDIMEMVIDAFGRYRLLTFDHDPSTRTATVEVAHEALIRQWGRLREWLDDSRDDLRTQRRLSATVEEWLEKGKDPSFLATGSRLEQLQAWYEATSLVLNYGEEAYIQASSAAEEKRQREEQERQEREEALEKRSQDRLRALVVVMTIAAVISVGLAILAFVERQAAEDARADAEVNAQVAQINAAEANSLALAANARNALIEHKSTLALSLALEADEAYQPSPNEVMRVLATTAFGPGVRYRLEGHETAVISTAISPDGRLSASGSLGGTLYVWNNLTGETLMLSDGFSSPITDLAFKTDHQHLYVATTAGNVYLLDIETETVIQQFTAHEAAITAMRLSDDESLLVTGSLDRTARLWDTATGELIREFQGHSGVIFDVDIGPNNERIATSSGDAFLTDDAEDDVDRTVRVWDVETGVEFRRFVPPQGYIRTVEISPDGQYVLSGSWNSALGGTLSLWDINLGYEVQRFFGHNDVVTDAGFSPDGNTIISGSWDRTIRVWNVSTGIEVDRFESFEDQVLSIAISQDGQFVLVGTGDYDGNEIEVEFEQSVDTSTWLIDLNSRTLLNEYIGHEDWVWSVDISPNGRHFISGAGALRPPSNDTTVRLWSVDTGQEIRRFEGHTSTVEGLAFSPGGTMFASGDWDGQVILWDFEGELIRIFEGHEAAVKTVVFSEDQTLLASGDSDGVIILWNRETGESLRRLTGHEGAVSGLAFSPNGDRLVSAGWDNTVRLWNVETGEMIRVMEGHTDRVNDVAFHPDGMMVLSGSWDGTLRLWDVLTGDELRRFVGHNGPVQGVAIDSEGRLALSGAADATVRLWDIDTGEELYRYDGHTNWVSEVVFTPDGQALSSAQDSTLRLWKIIRNSQEIVDWAQENRYIRELTCAERERYRAEPLCTS